MLRRSMLVLGFALSLLASACGGSNGGGSNGDPDAGNGNVPDADPLAPDADPTRPDADPLAPDAAPCTAGTTQCTNCIDDDGDNLVDGVDPECSGAADNDERTFATGIAGDNSDAGKQDCFFDGNSGGSPRRDCIWHTCCLLDNPDTAENECPEDLRNQGGGYDPGDRDRACPGNTAACSTCQALTPPGCDCFGCCTVCTDTECRDVFLNLGVSPDCSYENLDACATCFKSTVCGADECNDDPNDCVLCPGQDPSDLPSTCGGNNMCPGDLTECETSTQCADGEYCANGCCILSID